MWTLNGTLTLGETVAYFPDRDNTTRSTMQVSTDVASERLFLQRIGQAWI